MPICIFMIPLYLFSHVACKKADSTTVLSEATSFDTQTRTVLVAPPDGMEDTTDNQKEVVESDTVPQTETITHGIIGVGTIYETAWVEMKGATVGKSIIIEGGIHGDEIAGTLAIEALLPKIHITKGRVVWLPAMNRPAYTKQQRFIHVDLNKIFPGDTTKPEYEYSLAAELFSWVEQQKVDVVLTLHESRYLHDGSNPKTFGQTIVYGVKPMPTILELVLQELNENLGNTQHKFYPNYFPIATSSTEQFVENFHVEGFCAETWRGFELSTRIALQEKIIIAFLHQLDIQFCLDSSETFSCPQ